MNRKQLRYSAAALIAAASGIGVMHGISHAQGPPQGGPAGGPGTQGVRPGGPGPRRGGPGGPGMRRGGPNGPGAPPMGKPAGKAAAGTKTAAAVAVVPSRVHRKGVDPFRIPWTLPPPPPYVFENILPVRVAEEDIEPRPEKPVIVREEPALRVSGIMTGDGVFAILEQTGKVDIVKPGSSVDIGTSSGSRTYRVVSIQDDTVTLESKDNLTTYQQIVPLSDAPIGTNAGSFGGGAGGMRPGAGPGSFGGKNPGGGPGSFGPGGRPGGAPNSGGPGRRGGSGAAGT